MLSSATKWLVDLLKDSCMIKGLVSDSVVGRYVGSGSKVSFGEGCHAFVPIYSLYLCHHGSSTHEPINQHCGNP